MRSSVTSLSMDLLRADCPESFRMVGPFSIRKMAAHYIAPTRVTRFICVLNRHL